jgi:TonB family protein
MKYKRLIPTFQTILLLAVSIFAQQNERDRGIDLYKRGEYKQAVVVLKNAAKQKEFKNDALLMNFLGLAYINSDDSKNARKSLENAVKMEPQNSVYRTNLAYVYLLVRKVDKAQEQAEKALQIDPKNVMGYYLIGTGHLWENKLDEAEADVEKIFPVDPAFPLAYMLKADILVERFGKRVTDGSTPRAEVAYLKQAVDALETGVKKSEKFPNLKLIEEKLESLRFFYVHYSKVVPALADASATPDPTVTPYRILSKPKPEYSDNARQANVQGTIRLAILLGANGKVQYILKLKGLGYGLDEQAIRAATNITFEPKKKDGKPVSVVVTFDYGFNIY